mgnify:CR=1 FL=1
MKRLFTALALCLCAWAVLAGPFEDGVTAYERGDYAAVLRLWRPLADQGNASAQYNLGVMYSRGDGVPQDYAEALKWYRKAADQGEASAQYNLGFMYHNGQGVPQDYVEAHKWYRKAADQGHASAQLNLGVMYDSGQGVPQDYVASHQWLNLSAARATDKETRDMAVSNRDIAAAKMTPAQVAEAQKLAREWKPTTAP